MRFETSVDGQRVAGEAEPRLSLAGWLRQIGKTGVHVACDTSACGSCTVLVDGLPIKSCTMLAVQSEGLDITTVHGLTPEADLSPVQEAFVAEHGTQCGFCTPGFVVAATALLEANPSPTRDEIEEGLEGNLCRCTGYIAILRAVEHAAAAMRGQAPEPLAGKAHENPVS